MIYFIAFIFPAGLDGYSHPLNMHLDPSSIYTDNEKKLLKYEMLYRA